VKKNMKAPKNLEMYRAILTLETVEECVKFFDDLCSVTELKAMEQRYQVASLLHEGKIYNDILAETGASSATISRVNRSLQYGEDGYSVVFERLKAQKDGKEKK
jgi:TrpR-related protein YerC/YecD